MSSGIKTFLELQKDYTILMPIYQRDYVQGRGFDFAKGKYMPEYVYIEDALDKLLDDIKIAITDDCEPMLNLNFVYGKRQGDDLPPIDGQQRLTTLFLLHLYAFWKDKDSEALKNTCKRFQYRTRKSTEDFLDVLSEKVEEIVITSSEQNLVKQIRNQYWFQSEWLHDPSVYSMLCVLQKIHGRFYETEQLSQKLKTGGKVVVSFLDGGNLKENSLKIDEDLYIKLNARGKPLSEFENFKADILNQIAHDTVLYKDFSSKIDGDLLKMFWDMFDSNEQAHAEIDNYLMSFFHWFFACIVLVDVNVDKEQIEGFRTKETHFRIKDYYGIVTAENVKRLITALDSIYQNKGSVLVEKWLPRILKTLSTGKSPEFEDIVLFFALCVLAVETKGKAFDEPIITDGWFRIINNLINNAEIGTKRIQGILRTIHHCFRPGVSNFLEYFRTLQIDGNTGNLLGYDEGIGATPYRNPNGYIEEQKKANLMVEEQWRVAIKAAEDISYLNGQIWGVLQFSKIDGTENLDQFKHYSAKLSSLFGSNGISTRDLADFRRSLLCKGDFSIKFGGGRCFVSNNVSNDKWRNRCWKYVLNSSDSDINTVQRRAWFGELLDEIDFSINVKPQLQQIIQTAQIDKSDWRYHFIKTEGVMAFFDNTANSFSMFQEKDGSIILVPGSGTNGKNMVEYKTYALYCILKNQGQDIEYERGHSINEMRVTAKSIFSKIAGIGIYSSGNKILVEKNGFQNDFDMVSEALEFITKNDS
jgi:hypothetical protein